MGESLNEEDLKTLMKAVVYRAQRNAVAGLGPFAAAVVSGKSIISFVGNGCLDSFDPTAHAEVHAIREACKNIQSRDLSGCDLITSCYPCPMCFAAAYWANVRSVHYCCSSEEAAVVGGFDDAFIYEEAKKPSRISFLLNNGGLEGNAHVHPFLTFREKMSVSLSLPAATTSGAGVVVSTNSSSASACSSLPPRKDASAIKAEFMRTPLDYLHEEEALLRENIPISTLS
jgi:guanine deaminase